VPQSSSIVFRISGSDLLSKGKAAKERRPVPDRLGREFFLCPLLSGYQVQRINRPKFFEGIVVEVVWNVGENFRTERKKLDKFPQ
jgi:hypothetical protein